jgi:hypothetical protein
MRGGTLEKIADQRNKDGIATRDSGPSLVSTVDES